MSDTSRSSQRLLVDRRTNGGVSGNDVREIAHHPDKKLDIRGVDNH